MLDASPPRLSQACCDYVSLHKRVLHEAVRSGQDGMIVADRYARVFDGLLGSLYCAADAAVRAQGLGLGRVALVAVGGYGRGLVAPYGDVDVLFLCDDPADPGVARLAEQVLYPVWDAGVDIGHVVRGLDETLELSHSDIRTSTTLLDTRRVAGERTIVEELAHRARKEIFSSSLERFLEALENDTAARHERFGGSLYVREPELKLGRGGLRDLDVVMWAARACWADERFGGLVEAGALTEREWSALQAARRHLWSVRNLLHVSAGRRQDRLTYERQESIAAAWDDAEGAESAAAELMQRTYRHARTVARLADRMPDRARRSRQAPTPVLYELSGGVLVHDGRIALQRMDLARDPAVALDFYAAVVREGVPPDVDAVDAVSAAAADRAWARRLRREPRAAAIFRELLPRAEPAPVRRGSLLEELHEVGLLLALIPELEGVTGHVQDGAYNLYTVDAQSVMAVDRLRALARGELAADYPSVSRCAAEMPRPLPVYLAVLLHGLGAGHPDDAAAHGAAIAGPITLRLGLDPEEARHVQWLIEHQWQMYHWATRRDITEPGVIAELARAVGTIDRLRDLYLCTFACVSTIHPSAMSQWNARMLRDLFHAASEAIEGGSVASERVDRVRREALEEVSDPDHRSAIEAFLASVPDRYLLANTVEGIRWHARVVEGRRGVLAFGSVESGVGRNMHEVVVATDDRPGLLADLTAALAAERFAIDSAQLYTLTRSGRIDEAFDIFHVSRPSESSAERIAEGLEALRKRMEAILEGRVSADALLAGAESRPSWVPVGPRVPTEIHVDNAVSTWCTVIDVYTRDRPHLLHTIARALHEAGLTIALAKVNTEGHRVADVFYVRTAAGGKVQGPGELAALSQTLHEVIRRRDSAGASG